MSSESRPSGLEEAETDVPDVGDLLEISVDGRDLRVSSVSSLLRVAQATIREVARGAESTRDAFDQPSPPILLLSADTVGGDLVFRFAFAASRDSAPLPDLSRQAFEEVLGQFTQFIKELPQKGLWGEAVAGAQRRRPDSAIARRMDQLRMELRRMGRAKMRLGRRSISVDGDRFEIT